MKIIKKLLKKTSSLKEMVTLFHKPFGLWNTFLVIFGKRLSIKEIKVKVPLFNRSVYLRIHSSDLVTYKQVFESLDYKFRHFDNIKTIVDCGANIGMASLYFAREYPDSTIISIEPEESNYELLQRNTKDVFNIHCIKSGVWKKNAFLQIINPDADSNSFIVTESLENGIPALSICGVMKEYNLSSIDILKIDIEGSEKELFSEGVEMWIPYVKVIMIELHDRYIEGCAQAFFSAISKYNYHFEIKGESILIYFNSAKI